MYSATFHSHTVASELPALHSHLFENGIVSEAHPGLPSFHSSAPSSGCAGAWGGGTGALALVRGRANRLGNRLCGQRPCARHTRTRDSNSLRLKTFQIPQKWSIGLTRDGRRVCRSPVGLHVSERWRARARSASHAPCYSRTFGHCPVNRHVGVYLGSCRDGGTAQSRGTS